MSLTELDELLPDNEGEIFKQSEIDSHNTDTPALFKEPGLLHGNEDVIFKQTELLPVHEENLFKQPDSGSQLPFPPLDLPDFSQFPIYDGNFGDLDIVTDSAISTDVDTLVQKQTPAENKISGLDYTAFMINKEKQS